MNEQNHPVVTRDYSENLENGVMICGINFGYSKVDEMNDQVKNDGKIEPCSFFSDRSVNQTRFRDRLLTWFSNWDIILETNKSLETGFEKSFFQTNWLPTQTNSVTSDGKINVTLLVEQSDGLLTLLERRKPRIIVFVGANLIEAFNDSRLRQRAELIFGKRSGNAVVHRGDIEGLTKKKRFRLLTQSYGDTQIVGLPHVQSQGLTDEYIRGFKPIVQPIFQTYKEHGVRPYI